MTALRSQAAVWALVLAACQGMFELRDPCDGVTCSGHGECTSVDDDTRAVCVCDTGYRAEGLDCVAASADGDADEDVDRENDVCVPRCSGRECGPDGCGGRCLPGCIPGDVCDEDTGHCECVPSCEGRECGPDGCGGACPPGCGEWQICHDGKCELLCEESSCWGNPCSGVSRCEDGSRCVPIPPFEDEGSICSPPCRDDMDCPDIAPGHERCSPEGCIIDCESSADCPCGLECRDLFGLYMFCYP